MKNRFFSKTEAREFVGCRVQAKSDFPSVPAGTEGQVTKIRKAGSDEWSLRVLWQPIRKSTMYWAMLGEFSFNFRLRPNPVTDDFSKDDFERLATVIDPVIDE